MPTLSFRLFGPFEALDAGGQPIKFPTTKAQAMLAYLLVEDALRPNTSHQREKLMTLLWPEITTESAQTNLRQTLYRLRKSLAAVEVNAGQMERLLVSDRLTVQVNPAVAYWLDVAEFERGLRRAEQESEKQGIESLLEATALYRGDFLADVSVPDSEPFESWALQVREASRRKVLEALQQLGEQALAARDWGQAQAAARRQIALDDLNEAAYRQLMLALAWAGQRNEALTEFAALQQLLAEELGVEPTSETEQLAAAMRAGEVEEETVAAARPETEAGTDGVARAAEEILLDKVDRFWVKGVLQQSLEGSELMSLRLETVPDVLAAPWEMVVGEQAQPGRTLPDKMTIDRAFDDSGQALLILGEPGAGKTTILLELARVKIEVARANSAAALPVLFNLRSWADKRLPFAEWLVEELNVKYLIPTRIGRDWVKADRLMLLLDGLDEVRAESRAGCVEAINIFRQDHGLVPIAVSSRSSDYRTLPAKLRLGEAIQLMPVDSEQARQFLLKSLGSRAALAESPIHDPRLSDLLLSPLMLHIMILTFTDSTEQALASPETAEDGRQQLLSSYVKQMLRRRGKRGDYRPSETVGYLGWLARSLIEHNQTVFLLEQLQPSWLQSARNRWFYALATRVLLSVTIALGLIVGFLELALEEFSLPAVGASLLTSLIVGVVLGSAAAYLFQRRLAIAQEIEVRQGVLSLLARLVVVGSLAFMVTTVIFSVFGFDVEHASSLAYSNAFLYALFFGLRGTKRSVSDDIRPLETLIWSWKGAFSGSAPGLVAGLVLGVLDQYVTGETQQIGVVLFFALLGALFTGLVGGLRRGAVAGQDRPNSGLVLSLRDGARVGLVFGSVTAVAFLAISFLDPVNAQYRFEGLLFALRVGVVLGSFALLWYGGIEVLHHAVLRVLLRLEGSAPPRFVDFLDHAVDLIFLRRVGGGYIFVHQLLNDYFAGLEEV